LSDTYNSEQKKEFESDIENENKTQSRPSFERITNNKKDKNNINDDNNDNNDGGDNSDSNNNELIVDNDEDILKDIKKKKKKMSYDINKEFSSEGRLNINSNIIADEKEFVPQESHIEQSNWDVDVFDAVIDDYN
jgi:hypothetical protein